MYVQKYFMKLFLSYVQVLFQILILLYYWLLCILVQTGFLRMYVQIFCTLLFEVKTENK